MHWIAYQKFNIHLCALYYSVYSSFGLCGVFDILDLDSNLMLPRVLAPYRTCSFNACCIIIIILYYCKRQKMHFIYMCITIFHTMCIVYIYVDGGYIRKFRDERIWLAFPIFLSSIQFTHFNIWFTLFIDIFLYLNYTETFLLHALQYVNVYSFLLLLRRYMKMHLGKIILHVLCISDECRKIEENTFK